MCGIFLSLHDTETSALTPSVELEDFLRHRGPDLQQQVNLSLDIPDLYASAYSTVLSLRGSETVAQPLTSPRGGLLCFNGEAWRIDGEPVTGNDTQAVFDSLEAAAAKDVGRHYGDGIDVMKDNPVAKAIASISGPFAIVYFDKVTQRLYYGRDRLGRKSLIHSLEPGAFALASVHGTLNSQDTCEWRKPTNSDWGEVASSALCILQCATSDYPGCVCEDCVDDGSYRATAGKQDEDEDWFHNMREGLVLQPWSSLTKVPKLNMEPPTSIPTMISASTVCRLEALLRESMELRTTLPLTKVITGV